MLGAWGRKVECAEIGEWLDLPLPECRGCRECGTSELDRCQLKARRIAFRAEARARLCKSRVSREPIPGKPDAFAVRVDGREVGLLRRSNAVAQWSAVYLENGADLHLGTWHGKAIALQRLKEHVMREDERHGLCEAEPWP